MRKLVVLSFISLDGVMQAPGGPEEDASGGFDYGGWTVPFMDEASGQEMVKQINDSYDLLLGRKTYDIFSGYWPKQEENHPIGAPLNKAKKYVASRTLKKLEWENSVLLEGDVAEAVRKIKAGEGPMLQVHGSGNLIQTLLKNDLVDELWLKIFPITLGKGKRLFGEGTIPAAFTLTRSMVTSKGVIFANYKRSGDVQTGSFA